MDLIFFSLSSIELSKKISQKNSNSNPTNLSSCDCSLACGGDRNLHILYTRSSAFSGYIFEGIFWGMSPFSLNHQSFSRFRTKNSMHWNCGEFSLQKFPKGGHVINRYKSKGSITCEYDLPPSRGEKFWLPLKPTPTKMVPTERNIWTTNQFR